MDFLSFILGENNSENAKNSRLSLKKCVKSTPQARKLRLEPLEGREMLAVSAAEFAEIRAANPALELTANMSDYNIIEITAAELSVENLKNAISEAGDSDKSDLIVCRTTNTQNTITFEDRNDTLVMNYIEAATKGSVNIVGFGTQPLTFDAAEQGRVMEVYDSTVRLANLTITGGVGQYDWGAPIKGGGIISRGGSIIITNSLITNNTADEGGGIYSENTKFDIINCQITNNKATYGGGVYIFGDIPVLVRGSAIIGNIAEDRAGGLFNYNGQMFVEQCLVQNNLANKFGGGISTYFGYTKISDSSIIGNEAVINAGGIDSHTGSVDVENCTVAGNIAQLNGGGIGTGGRTTITNCEVLANNAFNLGGGVASFGFISIVNSTVAGNTARIGAGGVFNAQEVVIHNSIIAKNGYDDIGGLGWSLTGTYNLIGAYDSWQFMNGVDHNIVGTTYAPIDPKFALVPEVVDESNTGKNYKLNDWDLQIINGSPAIDTGNTDLAKYTDNLPILFDLSGKARVQGNAVDIGAYEVGTSEVKKLDTPIIGITAGTGSGEITVAWSPVKNARGFVLQYATDEAFTSGVGTKLIDSGIATYGMIDDLMPETTYYVRVMAKGDGTTSLDSDYSAVKQGTTLKAAAVSREEFAQIRRDNPDLQLSEYMSDYNFIEITADELSAANLKAAINVAGNSTKSDIIVCRTTDTQNKITYAHESDEIQVRIPSLIKGSVIIVGFGTTPLTLDAAEKNRVFLFKESDVSLANINITGGSSNVGSGILAERGSLIVTNCTITQNVSVYEGGGLMLYEGNLTITHSVISDNVSEATSSSNTLGGGGGIFASGSVNSQVSIIDCIISGNKAFKGAGACFFGFDVSIQNSIVFGNTANDYGGGIYSFGGRVSVSSSTIAGNKAYSGGGIMVDSQYSQMVTVQDSVITQNWAHTAANISGYFSDGPTLSNFFDYNPWFAVEPKFDTNGTLTNFDAIDLHLTEFSGDSIGKGAPSLNFTGEKKPQPVNYSIVTTLKDEFDLSNNEVSLREAIYFTSQKTTITFAAGLAGAILLDSQLYVDKQLTIDGGGKITLDGQMQTRIMHNVSNVEIIGCTVTKGYTTGEGGGILNTGFITVTNCTIAGNSAWQYGGIFSYFSSAVFNNSIITKNWATMYPNSNGFYTPTNSFMDYSPWFAVGPQFDNDGRLMNPDTLDLHLTKYSGYAIGKGTSSLDFTGTPEVQPVDYSIVTTLDDEFDLTNDKVSLREAIYNQLHFGQEIVFAPNLAGSILLDRQLYIDNSLKIKGNGHVTLDGQAKTRVLYTVTNLDLYNLTITNGNTNERGGGIYVSNSFATLNINGCTITKNFSERDGGGISTSGNFTIVNSTISENTANGSGGGIHATLGNNQRMVDNCIISLNTAAWNGGGIDLFGDITVNNSSIFGNEARTGGGISIFGTSNGVVIANSAIFGNAVAGWMSSEGGGIYTSGKIDCINSTIAGNYAESGGGVLKWAYGSYFNAKNSIIAANSSDFNNKHGDMTAENSFFGYGATTNLENGENGNIIGTASVPALPKFVKIPVKIDQTTTGKNFVAADWDLRLQSDSLAVDAGKNDYAKYKDGTPIRVDLNGKLRIVNGYVDMGAYEYQGNIPEPKDSLNTAWQVTFDANNSYTITDKIGNGLFDKKDVDIFEFTVSQADIDAKLVFTFRTSQPTNGEAVDTYMKLLDSTGKVIATNDDISSMDRYSEITWAPTASDVGKTFYVGISSYQNRNYDPTKENSGPGGAAGDYKLGITKKALESEPGDQISKASVITVTDATPYTITDKIGNGLYDKKDVDIFEFVVSQEDVNSHKTYSFVTAAVTGGANLDTYLKLFDSNGKVLSFNDDISAGNRYSKIDWTPTATDIGKKFYIGVSSYGNRNYSPTTENSGPGGAVGDYKLTVSRSGAKAEPGDTMPSAWDISFGQDNRFSITEQIGNGEYGRQDVDMYRLVVSANDVGVDFTFNTSGVAMLDTYMRIFDANGVQLAFNDDISVTNRFSELTYTFDTAGEYYIGISSYGNRRYNPQTPASGSGGATGEYELAVLRGEILDNLFA
ncbi:MAG: choice-of-anchor Q domain-containing protein [Thermoguttaceae bacterium]